MIKIKILTKNVNTQLKILATLLDHKLTSASRDNLERSPKLGFSIYIDNNGRVQARYITESLHPSSEYKKVPVYKSIRLLRELQACRTR